MIMFSKYSLTPKVDLNRFNQKGALRNGVILNVDGNYFDYHPWIEFGDLDVSSFLSNLKRYGINEVAKKSLDLWSRRSEISHKSFCNHAFSKKGDVVKIKYQNFEHLLDFLRRIESVGKIRIDFNNQCSFSEVLDIWKSIPTDKKNSIDYFEDPCPKSEKWGTLEEFGITIASDRNSKDGIGHSIDIYKPNVDMPNNSTRRQIFSSYMGHDLGRYMCYLELMEKGDLNEVHGLDTPNIYEEQLELFTQHKDGLIVKTQAIASLERRLAALDWQSL